MRSCTTIVAFVLLALARLAAGQTYLINENFDSLAATPTGGAGASGPPELTAAGWMFRKQGCSASARWRRGDVLDANPDTWSYMLAFDVAPTAGQPAAGWIILPSTPGIGTGDLVSFAFKTFTPYFNLLGQPTQEHIELRVSPTGGTSTGTAWNDVGDFTVGVPINATNCFFQDCNYSSSTPIPTNGRVAIRYFYDTWWGGTEPWVTFDTIRVTNVTVPVPWPSAGQTVHWTPAMNPIVIDSGHEIPAGATLIIDPGTEVTFEGQSAYRLRVVGTLLAQGTAAQPIRFIHGPAYGNDSYQFLSLGRVDLTHVRSNVRLYARQGSSLALDHCTFTDDLPAYMDYPGGFHAEEATVTMRDCAFTDARADVVRSLLHVERLTSVNSLLRFDRQAEIQMPVYIAGCSFANGAASAPIESQGQNLMLEPGNVFTNNLYPVQLFGGGILPGSALPATGNVNNFVPQLGRKTFHQIEWANAGVPYVWKSSTSGEPMGGDLKLHPGVTVRMEPGADIYADIGSNIDARGTPANPIRFQRHVANQPWTAVTFQVNAERQHLEHCVFDGATRALAVINSEVDAIACEFTNNTIGVQTNFYGEIRARKSRFLNNGKGIFNTIGNSVFEQGRVDADGFNGPNWFAGNTIAIDDNFFNQGETALGNWWGHASGPRSVTHNPQGTGDHVNSTCPVNPFLTSPPDASDSPPAVRVEPIGQLHLVGEKLILRWSASDDRGIASQRIEVGSGDAMVGSTVLMTLPPEARTAEVVVPAPNFSNSGSTTYRVVVTDNAGQENWDFARLVQVQRNTTITQLTDLSAGVYVGQALDVNWNTGGASVMIELADHYLDNIKNMGDIVSGNLWEGFNDIPAVSTDRARYLLRQAASNGQAGYQFFAGPFFSIRPRGPYPDAPPVVSVTSPQAGGHPRGGSIVNVQWTASDDEALRSFDVQASYNDGFTWNSVVRDLPGTARSFAWQLPASTGIEGVRVCVVARDKRYQVSSSTTGAFSIDPGSGACAADIGTQGGLPGSDGLLDNNDFVVYVNAFFAADPLADVGTQGGVPGNDGAFDNNDFVVFINQFFAGC